MRSVFTTLCLVVVVAATRIAAAGGTELFDPTSGIAVTLPETWTFALERPVFIATSENEQSMLIMVGTERKFANAAVEIEQVLAHRLFREVQVTEAAILLAADRGALEGAVAARGTAVRRKDGAVMAFKALVVKSGEESGLVLGAWQNDADADVVRGIVDSIHVRKPGMESGLELRDKRTGASISLPPEWSVYAYQEGLFAFDPERNGMTVVVATEHRYREAVRQVRSILGRRVFKDVKVGEFAIAAEEYEGLFAQVTTATGTAKDRLDDKEVQFVVVAGRPGGGDAGVLIVGAWKNEEMAATVKKTLGSIRVQEYAGAEDERAKE